MTAWKIVPNQSIDIRKSHVFIWAVVSLDRISKYWTKILAFPIDNTTTWWIRLLILGCYHDFLSKLSLYQLFVTAAITWPLLTCFNALLHRNKFNIPYFAYSTSHLKKMVALIQVHYARSWKFTLILNVVPKVVIVFSKHYIFRSFESNIYCMHNMYMHCLGQDFDLVRSKVRYLHILTIFRIL